jgi:FkbM family methyltransferase
MSTLTTLLLQWPFFRKLANQAYERGGEALADLFNLTFDGARIELPFEWRCEFMGRAFVLPVLPTPARSWSAARVWRWSGNRAVRSLYEDYLRARPAGVFFDVGANDGTHTYVFAASGYRCVSFEPQASCVEYIRLVCLRNRFDLVQVEQTLVMAEEAPHVDFFVSPSSWYSSIHADRVARFEAPERIRANALSLDRYCLDRGVHPTLLKIDVEGAEVEVLRGTRGVLREFRPDILVEVATQEPNSRQVWELLVPEGYRCFHVDHIARGRQAIGSLSGFLNAGRSAAVADFLFLAGKDI